MSDQPGKVGRISNPSDTNRSRSPVSKGLQWPHVFIVGLEEETLPDHRSVDDEQEGSEITGFFLPTCRLEKGSPGKGAGPDGKDLGADVDRVGPGAAYEKWQQTPEYQAWRKKTAEVMVR